MRDHFPKLAAMPVLTKINFTVMKDNKTIVWAHWNEDAVEAKKYGVNKDTALSYEFPSRKIADTFIASVTILPIEKEFLVDEYFGDRTKLLELANEFSQVLHEWLKPSVMEQIVYKNSLAADNGETDTCATHQYCDSNQAMINAFTRVMGGEPIIYFGYGDEIDTILMGEAWDIAKKNNFGRIDKLPPTIHFDNEFHVCDIKRITIPNVVFKFITDKVGTRFEDSWADSTQDEHMYSVEDIKVRLADTDERFEDAINPAIPTWIAALQEKMDESGISYFRIIELKG